MCQVPNEKEMMMMNQNPKEVEEVRESSMVVRFV